ncbi:hypothetical protein [Arcobacter roscoffensis]|uniref:Uncharacterized protein n=1 Tax=Arcobacter roscoffensis TaxID=2961520 RepID=A0ABY5E0L7_9BACT|nr:hypothetical protein [Arcobacter roscoffensis]UTJ05407.1 hypothetical protein NJU99_09010 [Arcobacter roscoffensis]
MEKKLLKLGYKKDSVDKIFQGKFCPPAKKLFILEDEYGIPIHAWRDIKSFIKNSLTDEQKQI